jgi:hypothetical protein
VSASEPLRITPTTRCRRLEALSLSRAPRPSPLALSHLVLLLLPCEPSFILLMLDFLACLTHNFLYLYIQHNFYSIFCLFVFQYGCSGIFQYYSYFMPIHQQPHAFLFYCSVSLRVNINYYCFIDFFAKLYFFYSRFYSVPISRPGVFSSRSVPMRRCQYRPFYSIPIC